MTALRISQMSGMVPQVAPRLLDQSNAQVAENCLFTDGQITPIYGKLQSANLPGAIGVRSIFRMYDSQDNSYWLQSNSDVDFQKGVVSGDKSFKVVYTSVDHEPRITYMALATSGASPYPYAFYVFGVAKPITAPTIAPTGGVSGTNELRAYVYTYRAYWPDNTFDESAPSPASAIVSGKIDATSWSVSGMDVAPPNSGTISAATKTATTVTATFNSVFGLRAYETVTISGVTGMTDLNGSHRIVSINTATKGVTFNIVTSQTYTAGGAWTRNAPHNTGSMVKAIYRSVGGAGYYFVGETAVGNASFTDSASTVIGSLIQTNGWEMPPADLQGLVSHPSGFMMGFSSGNLLCKSVSLAIYAWPVAYQNTTEHDIVGLGMIESTVIVGTKGAPYWGAGLSPDTLSIDRVSESWPCVSKKSFTTVGGYCCFATNVGLVGFDSAGRAKLLTEGKFTQKEWALLNPSSFIAGHYDGRYYAGYSNPSTAGSGMIIMGGGVVCRSNDLPDALYSDPQTGKLYLLDENIIYEWMGDVGRRLTAIWKSKDFVLPKPENLGAAKIDATFTMTPEEEAAALAIYNAAVAANQALITGGSVYGEINSTPFNTVPMNGSNLTAVGDSPFSESLGFTLYIKGVAAFSKNVKSTNVFRLPDGIKYDEFAVSVQGNIANIKAILVGSTPASLSQV